MDRKPRILLVEDEPGLLEVTKTRLEVAGYEVIVSAEGHDGLDKARRIEPDLIILDVMLPKLDGYEICTMLKQDTRYRMIPIVMLTARALEKDKSLGMECGADLYLTKPCRSETLLDQIEMLLRDND